MLMLDLFSGLGGASAAMVDRGWKVITVDNDPRFGSTIVADIREWSYFGEKPDLIWASPPCVEFSREIMPWCKTGKKPSMKLANAAKRIIKESNPRYWIIENVRAAVKYFGKSKRSVGPYFLWGYFPELGYIERNNWRSKESFTSTSKEERAKIPYELSLAVAIAIERQGSFYDIERENNKVFV
jgi:hypothetical protein